MTPSFGMLLGPAAEHREEPPATSRDEAAKMLPSSANALRMSCHCWTYDCTMLLDQLVTVVEEWLMDSWAW
ncbi:hypothetical protein Y1Q_0020080 [Alligator mississippiensis]|uniref:Uncharacterized protein n=1 Tax=Alligator mississippiensis TaxID=8496 RepID=A0A151LYX5_ALLMI|nr:hypothetical protein Y1Q_0020080 [Alligator mississippiensis]